MAVHEGVPECNVIICGARRVAGKGDNSTLRVARCLHVETESLFVAGVIRPNISHLLQLRLLSFDEQYINGAHAVPKNGRVY